MANVDIRVGKKDSAFFSANPTLVLKNGQFIFNETTSELFIGDGTTQLSSLVAINGASYTLTASEIGSVINATTDATPNDTDLVISVDSSVAKKNTWTQIKTFLKTYFDTIYTTTSAVASQITSALSGYVNTSGLTANYIPKASDSDTLANSQIFDNGTNVGIGTSTPIDDGKLSVYGNASNYATFGGLRPFITSGHSRNFLSINGANLSISTLSGQGSANLVYGDNIFTARVSVDGFGLIFSNNGSDYMFKSFDSSSVNKFMINHAGYAVNRLGVGVDPIATIHGKGSDSTSSNNCALFVNSSNAEILKLRNDRAIIIDSLTASQILELDANKVVISVAKNSGYNLALGTTSGTVAEGNDTRLTQAVRTIYKDFTASAALTGTTSLTLINSALIPANTVSVGNEVEVKFRAQRNTVTGVASNYLYFNTSASLSGATLIGGVSSANAYFASVRALFVKSPTDSETVSSSANVSSSDVGAVPTTTMTSLNIDWTANVYIIQAFQNAAVGDSTTSRGMIIKLS